MRRDQTNLGCLVALALAVAAVAPASAQVASQPTPPAQARAQAEASDEAADQHGVDSLRELSAERREEAVATARRAADDIDRQMERLQQQLDDGWERMSDATRARSRATMADLRQRRNAMAEWLGGMRHGSSAAWNEVRGGFVKSYQELAVAMRKARDEFARQEPDRVPETPRPETGQKTR